MNIRPHIAAPARTALPAGDLACPFESFITALVALFSALFGPAALRLPILRATIARLRAIARLHAIAGTPGRLWRPRHALTRAQRRHLTLLRTAQHRPLRARIPRGPAAIRRAAARLRLLRRGQRPTRAHFPPLLHTAATPHPAPARPLARPFRKISLLPTASNCARSMQCYNII